METEGDSSVDDAREDAWRACPFCGTRVQRVARRCLACHRDLEEEASAPDGPPESRAMAQSRVRGWKGPWLTLTLVIACMMLGGVAVIGVLMWLGGALRGLGVGS